MIGFAVNVTHDGGFGPLSGAACLSGVAFNIRVESSRRVIGLPF